MMCENLWQIVTYTLYTSVVLIIFKIYNNVTKGECKSNKRLDGQVIIVTGSSRGIGKCTALDLAKRGAKVILAGNNIAEANEAKDEIVKISGNKNVEFRYLDLGSFDSVRKFAEVIISTENRLDVLVNNAGIGGIVNKKTEDGLELGLQVNHYGHFLLTNLLIDLLKKSAPSRIVHVSSIVSLFGKLDFDNMNGEKGLNIFTVYSNSKLYNFIASKEFARRLEGTGVTSNSLYPGAVNTDIFENCFFVYRIIISAIFITFFKTPEEGAQTSIYLAVSDDVTKVSGKFFMECKEANWLSLSHSREISEKFWKKCCDFVHLKPEERLI